VDFVYVFNRSADQVVADVFVFSLLFEGLCCLTMQASAAKISAQAFYLRADSFIKHLQREVRVVVAAVFEDVVQ
jgi:hypothetical protein